MTLAGGNEEVAPPVTNIEDEEVATPVANTEGPALRQQISDLGFSSEVYLPRTDIWNNPWGVFCVSLSVLIWAVGVLILATPIVMYMMTFSLPTDSTPPFMFQNLSHLSELFSMYFTIMSSTLIPMWTRYVATNILRVLDIDDEDRLKQHKLSNIMSIYARTTATIIIPVIVCFYLNDGWWDRFST